MKLEEASQFYKEKNVKTFDTARIYGRSPCRTRRIQTSCELTREQQNSDAALVEYDALSRFLVHLKAPTMAPGV